MKKHRGSGGRLGDQYCLALPAVSG